MHLLYEFRSFIQSKKGQQRYIKFIVYLCNFHMAMVKLKYFP